MLPMHDNVWYHRYAAFRTLPQRPSELGPGVRSVPVVRIEGCPILERSALAAKLVYLSRLICITYSNSAEDDFVLWDCRRLQVSIVSRLLIVVVVYNESSAFASF